MSNAVTWSDELAGTVADERSSAGRRAVVLSSCILVATVGLSLAIYFGGKRAMQERAVQVELRGGIGAAETNFDLLRHVDHIALSMTALAIVGGLGSLVPLFAAAMTWRRRVIAQMEEKAGQWQITAEGLQAQMADARRVKDGLLVQQGRLETELKSLTSTNARLQEDLARRNRSERALTQKRQELESSKSVLQLHVQARTEQLEQLQRRYEMILNSAGEGICGLDLEGRATFVNPTVAKLTGWPLSELLGKTEREIFFHNHPGGPEPVPGASPDQAIFYRKDGTCFPVEVVKTPISENGHVEGSVLVFKDITERKQVEETLAQRAAELARSNAELEQFAFVASHDLQEPLRKIQAFGDRLKAKCAETRSPEAQDYLERMQNAAARMRTLINDLLAFSRVIRSSEPFVPVDLGQITKEVLGDLEVRIEKSGARVEVGSLPTLDADAMQMRQLLLNLLSNALKFQAPGNVPSVELKARTFNVLSGEQFCELTVQDNGIGFDEKYLDKMFAVFQRLHGRGEYEGTGVGLAVCRRIVDRHHGRIVASSRPGQGATFTVTLPVHHANPEAPK
ncbi:MAG TPA: ATP-binding protein [Candidatus Acidoferrum sp.]|jgi:signal transduction histidine kinase|nr:ATP-binding protein [Candidatus Acidoferrum sp.]